MGTYEQRTTGQLAFKFDPKNLEIRSKTVEQTLEPLVTQVTTLVNSKGVSNKKKGKSKRADVLVAAVEKSIENFLKSGMEIVEANPDCRHELTSALSEVRTTGDDMSRYSREFASDPCSSVKRANMVKAARALLSAVTRLLILADMIDVQLLVKKMRQLRGDLDGIKSADNQSDLVTRFGLLDANLSALSLEAARRAADLKNPNERDDLSAARATLKKNSAMLYTASKAFVRHPELDPARLNRDFVHAEMCKAIDTMEDVLAGRRPTTDLALLHGQVGELAAALDRFDNRVYMDPATYKDHVSRPDLEEQLEMIIKGAALIADSGSTREDRKNRIVAECNNVRQALQDLLSEYEKNAGRKDPSESLDMALVHLGHKTRDLRRNLRRAVVDHISDAFLDTQVPLLMLLDAAKRGDQQGVEDCGQLFLQHAARLCEAAKLACSMSSNEEGVKMVRFAAAQVEKLAPQVLNAARLLAARPQSKVAQENMDSFAKNWQEKVDVLTLAVDSIITIDDFLAVSESHILDDINSCMEALLHKDAETLDRTAGAIRGRALRVCNVVDSDMELHQQSAYTERVKDAVLMERKKVVPEFAVKAALAVDALNRSPQGDVDSDEFFEAARLVWDGIRDIRHAVLMNRNVDEIDSDEEYEEAPTEMRSTVSDKDANNERNLMRNLPTEEKKKIQAQVDLFNLERQKFDREVAKWDDTGNDIVVLAKHMCMIMMEMTDFTRGRGPLKTTMDVINAAKKISEAGTKLNALAVQIANQCAESESKKDLLAYLQRITLFCHQLNITSKVKADVQQVGDDLIVSGLESATSLIQAAKNLLGAVVLTVKSAYISSTKFPAKDGQKVTLVVWHMRPPEKKPLIRKEKPVGIIRRASQKRDLQPIVQLAEFQNV